MALELLEGCGMIRRSEKRRLIGVEASDTAAAGLGVSYWSGCLHAVSPDQFRGSANAYRGSFAGSESVLPLLNPF